jgi:hypothetical protein
MTNVGRSAPVTCQTLGVECKVRVQIPFLRSRLNELSGVMISELSNQNTTLHCFVDYPMFGIYSPRPVSAKSVLKRFWFADSGMGATSNIF